MNYETTPWKVIRWIGILPIFVAIYIVAFYVFSFIQRFYSDPDSWNMIYVTPILGSAIAGVVSMIYAMKVAPSKRHIVAFVLLMIVVLYAGAIIFFDITQKRYFNMLAIIGSTVGSIIGYFVAKDPKAIEEI